MRPRAVVAEQDATARRTVVLALKKGGYEVEEARDEKQFRAAMKVPMDLLLLDVMMPGMDGEDVGRLLREQHPVPVIVISEAKELEVAAMATGAADYLFKPINLADLFHLQH